MNDHYTSLYALRPREVMNIKYRILRHRYYITLPGLETEPIIAFSRGHSALCSGRGLVGVNWKTN